MTAIYALRTGNPVVVLVDKAGRAEELCEALSLYLPEHKDDGRLLYFPPWEILPYEKMSPHPEVSGGRLYTLSKLMERPGDFVLVTTIEALARKSVPPDILKQGILKIDQGDSFDMELLTEHLLNYGYNRVNLVEERGEFSVRGGIVDIYTGELARPVRIELFGDEVESIRIYDQDTQRSMEKINSATVYPFREVFYEGIDRPSLLARFSELVDKTGVVEDKVGRTADALENGLFFAGMERLLPLFFPDTASLFDYLPPSARFVVEEPEEMEKHTDFFYSLVTEGEREALGRNEPVAKPADLFLTADELTGDGGMVRLREILRLSELGISDDEHDNAMVVSTGDPQKFRGNVSDFFSDIRKKLETGFHVTVVVRTDGAAQRLTSLFNENDIALTRLKSVTERIGDLLDKEFTSSVGAVFVTVGELPQGFVYPFGKWMITTDDEVFGKVRKIKRRTRSGRKAFGVGVEDLSQGDYVTHSLHGVGRFVGIKEMTVGNNTDEYLELEYAGRQTLFLPISSINLIRKFVSGGGTPQLDKMGGATFSKTRSRVKKGIMDMAQRLLKLYATRKISVAPALSPDNNYHREFADTFEFDETEDQLTTIREITSDMELSKPMDRLVCGDVGYGKTEVAMRAAFKAVYDGKQVAVLVPTTLLAQQHYRTFTERFSAFPVTVKALSRFLTKKQALEIVERTINGEVDILIGTHRLLQKDIGFKNLGLVVIDEEQRFGVKSKERLRSMSSNAHVLTLTATPIPRTLHSSMVGIRELSVMETPPVDRLSIRNFISKFSAKVIREAIFREMDRGGQIYFVHNKVRSIHSMAKFIMTIAPMAKVAVAHGQMHEKELEQVMLDFIGKKYDILVCTTIVESGLDISSANTMIINRADHFGLSQLYQLRGRVGRDRHRAYCYYLVPDSGGVTEQAKKRLKAMEELAELGAGFKLAARDMEIRGAGNLLGPEQSGNIDAIGFETYCEMMEDAIKELKGEPTSERFDVQMNLVINGRIAKEYVPGVNFRMDFYNRLHGAQTESELLDVESEMIDRFGPPPEDTSKLLVSLKIKLLCKTLRVEKVDMLRNVLSLKFSSKTKLRPDLLVTLAYKKGIQVRFSPPNSLETEVTGSGWRARFTYIHSFLELVSKAQ